MRTLPICLLVAVIGCGDDSQLAADAASPDSPTIDAPMADAAPPDAYNYDFSCISTPWPTTAPDPIDLGGGVFEPPTNGAVADVLVQVVARGNDSVLGANTSDSTGHYDLQIATGGVALDSYKKQTKSGYLDSYEFPPFALFRN